MIYLNGKLRAVFIKVIGKSVNGDVNIFYNLRHAWTKAFTENSNEKYTYNFIKGLEHSGIIGVNQIISK